MNSQELEKIKDGAYSRPEKYKFERVDKLLDWATAIIKEAHNKYNTNFFIK